MENVNGQFMISLLIIALGYIGKRLNLVTEKDGAGLAKIVFNFTLPAIVIYTFSNMTVNTSLLLLPTLNIVYGLLISLFALCLFKKENRQTRGMLSMCAPGFNVGLFAYPLVEALWGDQGLQHFAMFDMGNAILVFGVCYVLASWFATEEGNVNAIGILKKMVRSVPLLAYLLALAINLAGFRFPTVVIAVSSVISRANAPLSLLTLGIFLSFSFDLKNLKNMLKLLTLRYIFGFVVGISLFFMLPFEPLFRYTLLIGFILPVGMVTIPYAVQFNYNEKFIGTINNITIIISFLIIWLMFLLFI